MSYEYHRYPDPKLKVIFHSDMVLPTNDEIPVHWHRNPELLLFLEGSAIVRSDSAETLVSAGELAVIEPDRLHNVRALGSGCRYYCLIPDVNYCPYLDGLPTFSRDEEIISICNKIVREISDRHPHYREAAKGYLKVLFSLLSRSGESETMEAQPRQNPKIDLVKKAVAYIYENFQNDISVDDIANAVGLSKYYLCHIFKEVTEQTVLHHINFVRCRNARSLLLDGSCNVSTAAYSSGFSSLSYFTKVYTSVFGNPPSKDLKK